MLAFEVLIKKVVQLLLLHWGHGVDLGTECLRVWYKFNGMVSFLPIWEVIEGFFGKDILELLVGFGHYVLEVHQVGPPCCLCKFLGDGLSGSDFFQSLANEVYEESVTLAHLIQVWACESWQQSRLSMFWLILWDFLNLHSSYFFKLYIYEPY